MNVVNKIGNATIIVLCLLFVITGCGFSPVTETVKKPVRTTEELSPLFLTDYRSGLEQAREENKPILVYFMSKTCVFSSQMTRETLSDPKFRDFARNFVCVQIDTGQPSSEKLCEDLQIKGTPTIQFMSPSGIPLQRMTQPQPAHELVLQMQSVLYSLAWKEVKYYR
ncbi:MAG: thioredoxin family protein [Thermoguttaceae bacterium]|nr:thioredoxin family protein [Thermoguttaceae bacterium]